VKTKIDQLKQRETNIEFDTTQCCVTEGHTSIKENQSGKMFERVI